MPAPVISVAQMREWEKATWATGRTESEVIACVGEIVARRVTQMTRPGDLVLILAGKGHNGDDARKAREHLPDWRVYLRNVTEPANWISEVLALLDQRPRLIVAGFFGVGLYPPLDAILVALVGRTH